MERIPQDLQGSYQLETRAKPHFFHSSKAMDRSFLAIEWKQGGLWKKQDYTIYAHHGCSIISPDFWSCTNLLKLSLPEGVERNNDIFCGVILRKSNKWHSAGDALRQEQRQWELRAMKGRPVAMLKGKQATGMKTSRKVDKNERAVTLISSQVKFTINNPLRNQVLMPQLQVILSFLIWQ